MQDPLEEKIDTLTKGVALLIKESSATRRDVDILIKESSATRRDIGRIVENDVRNEAAKRSLRSVRKHRVLYS